MKKLIMKLLGLNTLVDELALLKKQNEEFTNRIKHLDDEVNALEERVQEKIDEIEEPDVSDQIESYLNDNDYVSSSYVDDEIESKVSEKVEEAIEELDIEDKIDEAIEDLDLESKPASAGEQDIETKVSEAIKVTLERMVKALADQQG